MELSLLATNKVSHVDPTRCGLLICIIYNITLEIRIFGVSGWFPTLPRVYLWYHQRWSKYYHRSVKGFPLQLD